MNTNLRNTVVLARRFYLVIILVLLYNVQDRIICK